MKDPKTGRYNTFPCGSCKYCLETRRKHWQFRIQQEAKKQLNAVFYTLTYDDDNLPICETEEGEIKQTLHKPDLQKFLKRLRVNRERWRETKLVNPLDPVWKKEWRVHEKGRWKGKKYYADVYPIRYFAVGEYGELNGRPHYHAIVFNVPDEMKIKAVKDTWNKGNIHIGEVNEATIGYTCKYALKKENFAVMSLNPAIGGHYLDDPNIIKFHSVNDFVTIDGYKISVPDYYKRQERYLLNSKNFDLVDYGQDAEGNPIKRFEPTLPARLKQFRDFKKKENRLEAKYIKRKKNPIITRGIEDRNRYEKFGKTNKINRLD